MIAPSDASHDGALASVALQAHSKPARQAKVASCSMSSPRGLDVDRGHAKASDQNYCRVLAGEALHPDHDETGGVKASPCLMSPPGGLNAD